MAHEHDSDHPTGIAVPEGTSPEKAIRPRQRKATAALALRVGSAEREPLSYEEIAEVLGYPDARAARVAIEGALEKEISDDPKNRVRMRELSSKRLEQLLRSVWAKANNPESEVQIAASKRASEIIAEHAKLHGLNAPTEISVHTPTNDELQSWVAGVYAAKESLADEGDIFDGEIVEDADKQAIGS